MLVILARGKVGVHFGQKQTNSLPFDPSSAEEKNRGRWTILSIGKKD